MESCTPSSHMTFIVETDRKSKGDFLGKFQPEGDDSVALMIGCTVKNFYYDTLCPQEDRLGKDHAVFETSSKSFLRKEYPLLIQYCSAITLLGLAATQEPYSSTTKP